MPGVVGGLAAPEAAGVLADNLAVAPHDDPIGVQTLEHRGEIGLAERVAIPLLDDRVGRARRDLVDDLPVVRPRHQRFIRVPDIHDGNIARPRVFQQTAQRAQKCRPAARLALVERTYRGPFGRAPRHLPYRRAAMAFMRWQLRRGVLEPPSGERPGSPWWRMVNERLLRDGCESVALSGDFAGPSSSRTVDYWMSFADYPTARAWYRAHNASVVAAYLDHRDLAESENAAERFFMNVVLCRVLYTHALVAAPRISLGSFQTSTRSPAASATTSPTSSVSAASSTSE